MAVDLDPQASLTALYGIQPELDEKPSFYETLRYDDKRRPIAEIIQPTNFPNLDIVPANLELQEYEYETPLAMQRKDTTDGKLFYTASARPSPMWMISTTWLLSIARRSSAISR